MMHGREKSDSAIVAEKPTNKVVSATAEPVEPRAGAKGNASQQSTLRTQCRKCVSQALERIRQVRRHSPKVGAVCGNSARTDLGGGRSVMTVPTALVRPRVARRFRRIGGGGLASMYPASDWSVWCSGPSWISARVRSHYRTGLDWAIWVTSVRTRSEDRSSISSHPLADLGWK